MKLYESFAKHDGHNIRARDQGQALVPRVSSDRLTCHEKKGKFIRNHTIVDGIIVMIRLTHDGTVLC